MALPSDLPSCDISFIVTSRNDDFGSKMLSRLSLCAENLLQLANRHKLHGELIIVEWNSPPGPKLSDVLKLETASDIFAIRFIEAPSGAHERLRNSDVIPLFQMIAKNVGIRRARGKFICATNQDILLSDGLVAFLASGNLDHNTMYRIDRTDVPAEVPMDKAMDQQLHWCRQNVLRVHGKRGTFLHAWWTAPGFRALLTQTNWVVLGLRWAALIKQRWPDKWQFYKHPMTTLVFFVRAFLRFGFSALAKLFDPHVNIHTNACGDFTLLARDYWLQLRGYPEIAIFSMHLDSLFCYMASATGAQEQVIPYPAQIYHLEHGSSWAVLEPEERLRLFAAKPWLDYNLVQEIWRYMRAQRRAVDFNSPEWGLGDMSLKEIVILGGKRL